MTTVKYIDKISLIKELHIVSDNEDSLSKISKRLLVDPAMCNTIIEIAFDYQNDISLKAMMAIELAVEQNKPCIIPNLTYFTNNLSNLKNEATIQSASKICLFIAKDYTLSTDTSQKATLTYQQSSQIIEANFDWLLQDFKWSIKSNALNILFHIGKKVRWIHYEMKLIIKNIISNETNNHVLEAKNILKMIENRNIL